MKTDILIIDDSPALGDLYSRILRRAGYTTTVVATGDDALRVLQQAIPELILLDFHLPGDDGTEVAQRIRREAPQAKATRILGLSSHAADSPLLDEFRRVVDVLKEKPGELAELLELVKSVPK